MTTIRQALEARLNAMNPALQIAWENSQFNEEAGVPYQIPTLLLARPDNPTLGDNFYRDKGYLQVQLMYPVGAGSGDADAQALMLRAWFHRGLTLPIDGGQVVIDTTPEIATGSVQEDRWAIPVRIYFYANVFGE